jgi:hypothetical protein
MAVKIHLRRHMLVWSLFMTLTAGCVLNVTATTKISPGPLVSVALNVTTTLGGQTITPSSTAPPGTIIIQINLIQIIENADLQLCPGANSEELALQSWTGDLPTVTACARKILAWQVEAIVQQDRRMERGLCEISPSDTTQLEDYFTENWALSDTAAVFFNLGLQLKEAGQDERAREAFQVIVDNFSCAWAWDPSGPWFWSLSLSAREQLNSQTTAVVTPSAPTETPTTPQTSTQTPTQLPTGTFSIPGVELLLPSNLPDCAEASQGMNAVGFAVSRYYRDGETDKALACARWLYEEILAEAFAQQQSLLDNDQCVVNPTSDAGMGHDTYLGRYQALSHLGAAFIDVGKIYFDGNDFTQAAAAWYIAANEFSCAWAGDNSTMWRIGERANELLLTVDGG